MATTRSFNVIPNDKLAAFAKKYARPDPNSAATSSDRPTKKADIFKEMHIERNSEYTTGPDIDIDVCPNFTAIIGFICYYVLTLYPNAEPKKSTALSPPSMVAYCLYLLIGFMMCSDYEGRHSRSYYLTRFLNDQAYSEFFDILCSLYVPPFMMELFHALSPAIDPMRPGIRYTANLASSMFSSDFGRLIPPRVFLTAHHLLASRPTNANPSSVIAEWLDTDIVRTGATGGFYKVGHYIGAASDSGAHDNWLNSICYTLFNPVTARTHSMRPAFDRIRTNPLDNLNANYNAYIYALGLHDDDITELSKFLGKLSNTMKTDFDSKYQLGGVFSDLGGIQITTHGYSDMALPTWSTKFSKTNYEKGSISIKQYASEVHFLDAAPAFTGTKLKYPTDASTINKILYLVKKGKDHDPLDSPDQILTFDPRRHVSPQIRILSPYVESSETAGYALIAGMVIETFEIDGFSIPQPNLRSNLHEDNNQFAQSMIPMCKVRPATSQVPGVMTYRRTITDDKQQKITVSLYDMARNRLGTLDQTIGDSTVPAELPGFDIAEHVSFFDSIFSKFSFRLGTPPKVDDNFISGWSPYRYTTASSRTAPTDVNSFFFFTFRTMHGTNDLMSEVQHFSQAIPSA